MAFPLTRRRSAPGVARVDGSDPGSAADGVEGTPGGASREAAPQPLTERLVERAAQALDRRTDRRSVLQAAAVVGSALATGGVGYILRPGTAYASVCGDGASCSSGWTAFCCTVHGANTCPPYSFPAGWWKIDASPFCNGQARYIVDCNATCPTRCTCRCASGTCDQRRICCNQFRYGQCNTHIACAGPVVCRVALCTPPWVWSRACTTTSRTDNRTATHNAPCNPALSPTPTPPPEDDVTPTATSWGDDRIDVFARGTDKALWHQWWNGSTWSGWGSLGGGLASGPAACTWGPGRLDVFARGLDNALWHIYYADATWSSWRRIGGILTSAPTATALAVDHIEVFARGRDNSLWRITWNGSVWSPWTSLGGVLT